MRFALQMKKRGLFHLPVRPLLIIMIALTAVWGVLRFDAAGAVAAAFSRGLSGEAALAMLRAETSIPAPSIRLAAPRLPSAEKLLSIASPLLASASSASGTGKTPPGGGFLPEHPQPPPPSPNPPEMTPFLHDTSDAFMETDMDEESIERGVYPWDDRTWPQPKEYDPDARPLREVTLLPVAPGGGYLTDGTVALNNETQYSIDMPALLNREIRLKASADGPQILIIHTHGSESYLPDERDFYVPTDIERTEDTRYNVVRLGDEMTERLEELGFTVIHDRNIYDHPTYRGSYGRALRAIETAVKEHPTIQVVIDIHRDSISHKDGTIFKTICETEYGKTAQLMLVVGSDGKGLPHDGWQDNLAFAAQLQSRVLQASPTAMRPIYLRKERFNQHATPGSLILEVGTAANSLNEALLGVHLFCDAAGPYLAELLLAEG